MRKCKASTTFLPHKRKRTTSDVHTDVDWPCRHILDEKTQVIIQQPRPHVQMTIHQGKLVAPRTITENGIRKMLSMPSPPSSLLHKLPSAILLEISGMLSGGPDVAALLDIDKTLWGRIRPLASGPFFGSSKNHVVVGMLGKIARRNMGTLLNEFKLNPAVVTKTLQEVPMVVKGLQITVDGSHSCRILGTPVPSWGTICKTRRRP